MSDQPFKKPRLDAASSDLPIPQVDLGVVEAGEEDDTDEEEDMEEDSAESEWMNNSAEELLGLLQTIDDKSDASANDLLMDEKTKATVNNAISSVATNAVLALSPLQKQEVLDLICSIHDVSQKQSLLPQYKLFYLSPLVFRLTELLPKAKPLFKRHGWNGLRFQKGRIEWTSFTNEMAKLRQFETKARVVQLQAVQTHGGYTEAADRAVLRRTVVVSGLPPAAKLFEATLLELLARFGAFSRLLKLGEDFGPHLAGMALVQYRSPKSAEQALSLNGHNLHGYAIQVEAATKENARAFGVTLPSDKYAEKPVSMPSVPDAGVASRPQTAIDLRADDRRSILVKGLPQGAPVPGHESDLIALFRPHSSSRLDIGHTSNGHCTGSAIVQFPTSANAKAAIDALNGTIFAGSRLILHFATREDIEEHSAPASEPPPSATAYPAPPSQPPPPNAVRVIPTTTTAQQVLGAALRPVAEQTFTMAPPVGFASAAVDTRTSSFLERYKKFYQQQAKQDVESYAKQLYTKAPPTG